MARRLRPHQYTPDPSLPPVRGERLCRCGLPQRNSIHQLPDTGDQQAEHHRRIGDQP